MAQKEDSPSPIVSQENGSLSSEQDGFKKKINFFGVRKSVVFAPFPVLILTHDMHNHPHLQTGPRKVTQHKSIGAKCRASLQVSKDLPNTGNLTFFTMPVTLLGFLLTPSGRYKPTFELSHWLKWTTCICFPQVVSEFHICTKCILMKYIPTPSQLNPLQSPALISPPNFMCSPSQLTEYNCVCVWM